MAPVNTVLGTYKPEDVDIVIGNANFSHIVSGTVDGSFLTLTRVIPHATLYTGADASNARVKRRVRNYDINLTLHQSSESNDVFSELLRLDEESSRNEALFYITIKDNSGRTVASSRTAFIGTTPDVGFGVELSEREWILHAINMQIHIGGNAQFTGATWDTVNDLGLDPDVYWVPGGSA